MASANRAATSDDRGFRMYDAMTAARPVQVHQVLATLGYGDAIGNAALGIQRVLRAEGYVSDIFVETAQARVAAHTRNYQELAACSSPGNLLIHHFSIGSRASRLAFSLPDKMVLVYHNVTPAHYFAGVNDVLAARCYLGRRELAAYVPRVELALGDSEFNRQELVALGFRDTAVLPVIPDFSHLDVEPDPVTLASFDDGFVNILFVGRIITNKKIEDVLRFFHAYNRFYNPRSRLIIVGSWHGFDPYYAVLQHFVTREGIRNVHFTGHVSNEELAACYEVADLFLCASEHEGFCVPVIESFHKQVPVLAFRAAAVPATMDGGGVLYDVKNPELVAALIDVLVSDEGVREQVLERQQAALDRLEHRDFATMLLGFVNRLLT